MMNAKKIFFNIVVPINFANILANMHDLVESIYYPLPYDRLVSFAIGLLLGKIMVDRYQEALYENDNPIAEIMDIEAVIVLANENVNNLNSWDWLETNNGSRSL